MDFKAKMCAKTIRNNIASGDIYEIKPKDMIYNKVYKEKNKRKKICERVPPEKSIEYRPKEALSNRKEKERSSAVYINREKDKRRNNN